MSSIIPVGIDLGTSFCAVSSIDADGRTQMIRNGRSEILTPSAVYFSDEQIVVGAAALEAALRWPDRVAEDIKRDMGLPAYRRPIGGQDYPPEVIQSCILRQLRHDIVAALGEDFQAVITVPAYFDECRRNATYDAAVMSGLAVLDIVNEPTAAALSFGERLGYLTPEGAARKRINVLVYDLGGGTFDVSVIRLDASEIRTLATDGDFELGGLNWDQRLAEQVESQFRRQCVPTGDMVQVEQIALQRLARSVKHSLTDRPLAVVEYGRDDRQLRLSITRQEFEHVTADLLERTMFTTRQALQASGLIWSDIDRLLLVGGSSRMPGVRQGLRAISGMEPDAEVNPDEAVARGAAIYARYLLGEREPQTAVPKLRITDVNSHSLGLEGVNLSTLLAENVSLIPRNTPLPCEVKRTFVTRSDNQPNVKIQLLEGESSVTAHCSKLATATIRHLPPGLPKGTPIDVRYSLQNSGRLAVRASIRGLGDDAHIELQRVSGLNDRKVQTWKKIVCRDGGYRDYKDALAHFFVSSEPADEVDASQESDTGTPPPRRAVDMGAAVDFGAPRAAADSLQTHFNAMAPRGAHAATIASRPGEDDFTAEQPWPESPSYRSRSSRRSLSAFNIVGHLVFGVIGLALGYFALCWIRPDLNFLGNEFSGESRAESEEK